MSLTIKPTSIKEMLPRINGSGQSTKESFFNAVVEDEETSIYQRVAAINRRLFDEYRSELLAYRQEIGTIGSNR